MSVRKYLETSEFLPLEKLKKKNYNLEDCIPFNGSLRRHPYDKDKIVLIYHAFREDPLFFEFRLDDIKFVEDMPSIVTEKGEYLKHNRIWVQKGSLTVRYDAFEVNEENCREYMNSASSRKSS